MISLWFDFLFLLCIVVSPVNAEATDTKGKHVRLSIVEESRESKTRDSIMTPSPRISEGIHIIIFYN